MADMDFTVNVDTTPAVRSLNQLEKKSEKVTDSFGKLKSALAGLAIGALIARSMQLADRLQDVSDATGIARENVLAFGQAVQEAGGSMEGATNGLNNFVKSIDDAAKGSKNVRDAFSEVGVSLSDLSNLSERALLAKTLKGLEGIDDKARSAAIGAELFGKAFKGVAGQNISSIYTQAVTEASRYSQSIKSISDLQGKLDRTFVNLQLSILKAIEPLANFLNKIPQDKLDKMIEGFIQLAAAGVAIAATAKSLQMLGTALAFVGAAFASFKVGTILVSDGIKILSLANLVANKGFYDLGKTIGITLKVFKTYSIPAIAAAATLSSKVTELGKTGAMLAKRMGFAIAAFATVATGAKTAMGALGLMAAGIVRMIPFVGTLIAGLLALNEVLKVTTGISLSGWFDKGAEAMERWVTDTFPKLAAALNWLGNKMGMAPSPMEQKAQDPRAALRKQEIGDYEKINSLLAAQAEEEEKAAKKRKMDADARLKSYMQFQLNQKQDLENLQQGLRLDVARLAFERDLLIQNGQLLNLTEDQVAEARVLQGLDEQRLSTVRQINQQIESLKLNAEEDTFAQAKILDLQKQIKEVNKSYFDQTTAISGSLRSLQDAQYTVKVLEEDRLRTVENITRAYDEQIGRTQALGDQLKNVRDQISEQNFERGLKGMMPFKIDQARLAREIDKAALSAQQAFAESFGDADALGPERTAELFSGLERIKAQFDSLKTKRLEDADASRTWASGWAEAFAQFGDNASNAADRAAQAFSAVTGNMNSAIDNFVESGKFKFGDLAQSIIKDLIKIELKAAASKLLSPILSGLGAGLSGLFGGGGPELLGFANGGNPPINRPSLVGEGGPELFVPKTAGTIVPNGGFGGQTQVTNNYINNNIQAVDAKSVAQLFAENRRTLLGTMKLAEKETSYR